MTRSFMQTLKTWSCREPKVIWEMQSRGVAECTIDLYLTRNLKFTYTILRLVCREVGDFGSGNISIIWK